MPKWLRRLFRSILIAAVDAAFDVGRQQAHLEMDKHLKTLTGSEQEGVKAALDAGLDHALDKIKEEL